MILRTNSRITSLLCYLYPLLVAFEYHDAEHVKVTLDVDGCVALFTLLMLASAILLME